MSALSKEFRIASVPYINALPLIVPLLQTPGITVSTDVPSKLPALLDAGSVDAILVSAIEPLLTPGRAMVDGVGIASYGPVASVRLFSRVPIKFAESVALDTSSMISNRLARWMIEEEGGCPNFIHHAPDLEQMLQKCDACVLIGDLGMVEPPEGILVYDLGELWTQATRHPFLWAGWVCRPDLDLDLVKLLSSAHHQTSFGKTVPGTLPRPVPEQPEFDEQIIRQAIDATGFGRDRVLDYFRDKIVYDLGEQVQDGYRHFARQIGAKHMPKFLTASFS